ncbi:hypothetical protein B0H17DRAFT_1222655 [Mycena rosella]|uniref:Uncharacterized protein n=1 Tax=Mycena rosella TaxID=1033263 RepID=A0AAD7AXQ7_MYCRO|nr:hypothetical protein B0H17DRAFT_1222655 [Mycena rosella]
MAIASPMNLVPTIDSAALPSTPATEWAANTNDILFYSDGSAVQTPGPAIPGAFPEELSTATGSNGEAHILKTYLAAEADVQRALTNVAQAAKAYLPQQVAEYFGAVAVGSLPSKAPLSPGISERSPADMDIVAPLILGPEDRGTDLNRTVDITHDSDSTTTITPASPASELAAVEFSSPVRPPLMTASSSFHSHAFGPARSASSSIYSVPSLYSVSLHELPDGEGYAPLASTASLAPARNSDPAALFPSGVPFTPIPPIAPSGLDAYFPPAGDLHEADEGLTTESNSSEVDLSAHNAHIDEEPQRATFSDRHYGILGREGASMSDAAAGAEGASDASAAGDGAVLTSYGIYIPGAVHPSPEDGAHGEEHAHGEKAAHSREGSEEKGTGRRSRLVARIKEKMHV